MRQFAHCLGLVVLTTLSACGGDDGGAGGGTTTAASTSGSGGAGGSGGSACSGAFCTGQAAAALVSRDGFDADLATIAHPRETDTPGWQAVQDLCADRLTALGYQVERQDYGTGVNVIGVLPGSDLAAERVLLSAHYDGVPDCDAADDNGTGVSAVLESARVLAQGHYRRTLVLACWDEEERGLVGSEAYVAAALAAGDTMVASFVYEMIGYRSDAPDSQTLPPGFELIFPDQAAAVKANDSKGDFITVIGDVSLDAGEATFATAASALGLPAISLTLTKNQKNNGAFADLQRSDHASFWKADVPALMLTDTANFRNPHYHCYDGPDEITDLDTSFSEKVTRAAVWTVVEALQAQ